MKKIGNSIFTIWLGILLLLSSTSTEYIHSFFHHEDSIEKETKGFVIEKQHHHCSFLGFTFFPFSDTNEVPVLLFSISTKEEKESGIKEKKYKYFLDYKQLRGPPII